MEKGFKFVAIVTTVDYDDEWREQADKVVSPVMPLLLHMRNERKHDSTHAASEGRIGRNGKKHT